MGVSHLYCIKTQHYKFLHIAIENIVSVVWISTNELYNHILRNITLWNYTFAVNNIQSFNITGLIYEDSFMSLESEKMNSVIFYSNSIHVVRFNSATKLDPLTPIGAQLLQTSFDKDSLTISCFAFAYFLTFEIGVPWCATYAIFVVTPKEN